MARRGLDPRKRRGRTAGKTALAPPFCCDFSTISFDLIVSISFIPVLKTPRKGVTTKLLYFSI
jgi:hypothetical protein